MQALRRASGSAATPIVFQRACRLMMADLWHIALAWMMWPDFAFFEALARVRGIANIPMATMLPGPKESSSLPSAS